MSENRKMTNEELSQLKQEFKKQKRQVAVFPVIAGVIMSVMIFVPAEFFSSRARRKGLHGSMVDNLGMMNSFLIVLMAVLILFLIFLFFVIRKYKADLELGEKIIGIFEVRKFEMLSEKQKSYMANGEDAWLLLKKNKLKVKRIPFNTRINGSLVNAKFVKMEYAPKSKFKFLIEKDS